jgi:hypothetical protein
MLILPNRKVLRRRDGFDPSSRRIIHQTPLQGRSTIAASIISIFHKAGSRLADIQSFSFS